MRLILLLAILLFPVVAHAETVNAEHNDAPLYGYRVEGVSHKRLMPLYAVPTFTFGQTYYVRNDGSVNCSGLVNAPYPGSGVNQPCAFSSVQQALDTAKRGDTIKVHAGDEFRTAFGFNLTDKGPITGTDADYITLTTDDPSGIPAALSNYPRDNVSITPAMAAKMPRLVSTASYPAIWVNRNAKAWRIDGFDITSIAGANTIRLIGLGEDGPRGIAEFPDRIHFRRIWAHPIEDDGSPATAANVVRRSAESGFYFEATNSSITESAITGFISRYNPVGSPDLQSAPSVGLLMTTWADNFLFERNLVRAWTYGFFFGGGSKAIADPSATATVSNCSALSCNFSSTTGLTLGKPVAILVYVHTDANGNQWERWGSTYVASISGSTVNFTEQLCNSDNTGGNGNVCRPFDSNNPRQLPADGSQARWEGYQPQRVVVQRNIFDIPQEWTALMNDSCAGKGYFEVKSCHFCKVEFNRFRGCTGHTITARNQSGADPWSDLDGFSFSYNFMENSNSPLNSYLNDGGNRMTRSRGGRFVHNIAVGEFANPDSFNWYRVIAGVFNGGDDWEVSNNTIMVGKSGSFTSYADPISGMNRMRMENNIFRVSLNKCFSDGSGTGSAPMTSCWRNSSVQGNVLVNMDKTATASELSQNWTIPFPRNSLVQSLPEVGFINAGNLDALSNLRLAPNSQFKGKGTDGKDPGADVDLVMTGIFGTGIPSLPSPTPLPSISPTPAPTPASSPTPQPSPTGTPIPGTTTDIQGRVLDQDENSVVGALVSAGSKTILSRAGDGYYRLDGIAIGATVTATKAGYTFPTRTVVAGIPEQFYGIKGQVVVQPSPSASPTPQPTPTATPQPTATPSPTPSASPSPSSCPACPCPCPSPTPVSSPSPSPTPTSTPVASPSPSPTPVSTPTPVPTPAPVETARFFASTTGSSSGDGSSARPWDLATFINKDIGDAGCIRDGVYAQLNNYVQKFSGTAARRQVLRPCKGETVVIDGRLSSRTAILTIDGSFVTVRDIEVVNTNPTRVINVQSGGRGDGIRANGRFIEIWGGSIRDAGNGLMSQTGGEGLLVDGTTIQNNGWSLVANDPTGHGHGLYLQNSFAIPKTIRNTVVSGNYNNGIDMHTSTPGKARSLVLEGNVTQLDRTNIQAQCLAGDRVVMRNHFAFSDATNFLSGACDLVIEDSHLVALLPTRITNWRGSVTRQRNQVVGMPGSTGALYTRDLVAGQVLSETADNNTYWQGRTQVKGFNIFPGGSFTFAEWQAKGFDTNSTHHFGKQPDLVVPSGNRIVVYNLRGATQVTVDPKLPIGTRFTLRNAFKKSEVLHSGVYSGPVTITPTTSVEQPINDPAKVRVGSIRFVVVEVVTIP